MNIDLIIFPSSSINKKKVDEDLYEEYVGCNNTNLFNTIIFSYDNWFNKRKLVLSSNPQTTKKAIYRGWMMHPEIYKQFYEALKLNNIELITSPESYELMHVFPNAYSYLKEDTAKIKTFPLYKQIDVNDIKQYFDKFIVKDYVKSVKGTEFPKYFDSNIAQEDFDNAMDIFYKYRGDLLTGGICIKEYLKLKHYENTTNEYRVFYVNGNILSVSKNSKQQNINAPIVPNELINKYSKLNSPYYTIDFAELEDGTWKILECGDGSVSGLSEFQNIENYYKDLYYTINKERN